MRLTILPPLAFLTTPPYPYLLILCKLPVPIDVTAFLRITNSPGVNIAGTLSLLPVPGTTPPLANAAVPPALLFRDCIKL